jgi:hypothetical protein
MPSQLLAALPGLHGTVLGIGTAFLSAFFIQAQQKIYEFEDRAEEVRKGMKDFISPAFHFQAGSPDIYDDAGSLDWVKVQALLRDTRLKCRKSVVEDPYEFEFLDDEVLLSLCKSFCSTLYRIHVSYPFEGYSMIASSQTEKGDFSSIDDAERFQALAERVNYLDFCWASAGEGYTALARRASEIEASKIVAEIEEKVEHTRTVRGNDPKWDEQRTRDWFTEFYSSRHPTDYASMVISGFQRMNEYGQRYLALYQDVVEVKKKVKQRYRFKELSVVGLLVLSWVAGFGIIVPLVLLEMEPNFRNIPVLTPYFVLVLSIAPYLICGCKAWRWLKSIKL